MAETGINLYRPLKRTFDVIEKLKRLITAAKNGGSATLLWTHTPTLHYLTHRIYSFYSKFVFLSKKFN